MKRPLLAAALILLSLTALACGSDKAAKPAPTAMPTLAAPALDSGLRRLSEGSLKLEVAAGGRQAIDPLELARQAGTPPTCADFVFAFSWRLESGEVYFSAARMGGATDLGSGAAGEAMAGGCVLLQAANNGGAAVAGELRYVIAQVVR